MDEVRTETRAALERVLGYLNFSSGTPDSTVLATLNRLFLEASRQPSNQPQWRMLQDWLMGTLAELTAESAAFQDSGQASVVASITFEGVLPGYRAFHRDLLFHQSEESLF